ncbi:zinc finger protein SNAI2-like [Cylas formicarius]|uniref:zinc finger protein SNAI2-like n=1 Tax=Cylas formicarius TaxID=197179 RepID=UPI002958B2A5|nr:zinc finger protein SNAI2-like [Cylas formicarius]
MPITIMAKNYSHCPLKKRPIIFKEDEIPEEPENLSTKPEDLSRAGRLASVSPPSSPNSSPAPLSPVSSISIASPPSSPPISSPSPTVFYPTQPIKVESRLPYPTPISPEYAPQTWHRSVAPIYHPTAYHYMPYTHYPHENLYMAPTSPYSDSSLSPPHHSHHVQQPLQPLAFRPTVYSSMDQSSLSPNSSTNSPPPVSVPAEDLSEKRRQGVRHQCPDCGKSYSTFAGLSKHRQFHCAAGDGPKKSFSCKYCEKVYVSLGALKMHIRTHTLPCKCTICGKAFSRPWLLQGHIRTHTGEKPFSCTYCNRAFADRSNLRAHLQTHSDVKKYSCTSCSKTFSRMSLLTKHTEGGCTGSSPTLLHNDKMY